MIDSVAKVEINLLVGRKFVLSGQLIFHGLESRESASSSPVNPENARRGTLPSRHFAGSGGQCWAFNADGPHSERAQ